MCEEKDLLKLDTILLLFSPLVGYATLRFKMTQDLIKAKEEKRTTVIDSLQWWPLANFRKFKLWPLFFLGILEGLWWPYIYSSDKVKDVFWGSNKDVYDLVLFSGLILIFLVGLVPNSKNRNLEFWKRQLLPYFSFADLVPILFFALAWNMY